MIGPGGRHFEVQIRTEEMHRIAEEGIAAHWKYKEGQQGPGADDQRIAGCGSWWNGSSDMRDPGEFMSTLKVDLYPEEVYTFTPTGKVIVLPRDATPIDFAYAIHSRRRQHLRGRQGQRPHRAAAATTLQQRRRGGDPDAARPPAQQGLAGAGQDLAGAQQDQARHQRHRARQGHRDRPEVSGKRSAPAGRAAGADHARRELERVAGEYGYSKMEDLHAALGYGKFSARQVLQKLAPDQVAAEAAAPSRPSPPRRAGRAPAARAATGDLVIKVKGIDDLLVYRAKCCNPIRGEGIVGYVTRGKGIAVHSTNCTNVQNLMYEVERKIDVEWARAATETFPVRVVVHTDDRPGMLNQLTSVLFGRADQYPQPGSQLGRQARRDGAVIDMTVEVRDKKQLERVVAAIRRISGVRDVERTQSIVNT